ncbi:Clp protease N-terminal domain-containing protein [Streptomyces sp. S.PB5]|uniref:Clp protease N-terminal domain-containing protein n=1 Tax=Streptomyces sp. S.PB5 TaxID=3020844 RepID=UPI0025B14138|nr:Clp protease N-terminal domain-containing protein [Streptomyces sp. S.PB5]MDN3027641.1 Clp protease N-terminal domain-containing protein [Streptomyces sp. S.PB5]
MPPRIPRQSANEPGGHRADIDAGLGEDLAAVVSGARRRALRDGDRQIDTAHLLHSLLEHDAEVRAVFEDGPQLARLLGYLVQRSIGYGLRWQGSVEDSGAVPVVPESEGYSPLAAGAMEHAAERAVRRGLVRANGTDLLSALVLDPEARAVEVLTHAGIEAAVVLDRIESRVRRAV